MKKIKKYTLVLLCIILLVSLRDLFSINETSKMCVKYKQFVKSEFDTLIVFDRPSFGKGFTKIRYAKGKNIDFSGSSSEVVDCDTYKKTRFFDKYVYGLKMKGKKAINSTIVEFVFEGHIYKIDVQFNGYGTVLLGEIFQDLNENECK